MSTLCCIICPGECRSCTNKPRIPSRTTSAPKPRSRMRLALCAASLNTNLQLVKKRGARLGCHVHSSLADANSLLAESTLMASVILHRCANKSSSKCGCARLPGGGPASTRQKILEDLLLCLREANRVGRGANALPKETALEIEIGIDATEPAM